MNPVINSVRLTGKLIGFREYVLRSGTKIVMATLECPRRGRVKDNKTRIDTPWFWCAFRNDMGDKIRELPSGTWLYVEGSLCTLSFDDGNRNQRRTYIDASKAELTEAREV